MTALGERIRQELGRRGWTQQRLVEAHEDLRASTVSRVITGSSSPDLTTLDAMASVLEIPIEDLVRLALLDLSGADRGISLASDVGARISALAQAFPWLAPVVDELSQFDPADQSWILAILEAHRRLRDQKTPRD